jgi:pimeloyl-[acyl-carrier protein] synthase
MMMHVHAVRLGSRAASGLSTTSAPSKSTGSRPSGLSSAPIRMTKRKIAPMWTHFAPRLQQAVTNALRLAGERGCPAADVDHLLVAIARDEQCGGAIIMLKSGVVLDSLIARALSLNCTNPPLKANRFDDRLLAVLQSAIQIARRLGDDHADTEHFIAALADHAELPAGKLLLSAGLTQSAAMIALESREAAGLPPEQRGVEPPTDHGPLIQSIRRLLRMPLMPLRIYMQKSLAHPKFRTDPYPLYRWLRERQPVRRDPLAPVWILTRYDDVTALLKDDTYLKDPFITQRLPHELRRQLAARENPAAPEIETVSMLFLDPPDHTRIRAAFTRGFTPRNLQELRPRIQQLAAQCLDSIGTAGEMDLISTLAYPLPVMVIAEMLGFPPADFERIKHWSDDMTQALSMTVRPDEQARATMARDELKVYFHSIVADLRRNPRDNLISRLLAAADQPAGLNIEEIFSNSVLLLAAGHETTANLIGNGILALMQNREQWELLVSRPQLVESAVEEMLRFDSPVQWTSRLTAHVTEIAGQRIPEGRIVLGCVGAANRDPARFADPDRLDIQRPDNKHLSFGTGIHFCLGAALARMEAQIALAALIERFPKMRLATNKLHWMKGLTFRGVKELRLVLR